MAISISNYPVYLQDGLKLDRAGGEAACFVKLYIWQWPYV